VAPLAEYLARYPRMTVDWTLHDRTPEFIGEGIDCAIRMGEIPDPSVVAIRLGDVPRIVVGSPALLDGGAAARLADLSARALLSGAAAPLHRHHARGGAAGLRRGGAENPLTR